MTADEIAKAMIEAVRTPPAINMPDHPVRQAKWYQLFCRLARPTLDWSGVIGANYVMWLGHAIERPMAETYAGLVLLFVGGLFGIRTFEKIRGVA